MVILFDIQTTNYMEDRPSSEAVISSASLEIPFVCGTRKFITVSTTQHH